MRGVFGLWLLAIGCSAGEITGAYVTPIGGSPNAQIGGGAATTESGGAEPVQTGGWIASGGQETGGEVGSGGDLSGGMVGAGGSPAVPLQSGGAHMCPDGDGDGICNAQDVCPIDNPNDPDGDGLCTSVDPCPLDKANDSDGDGVCDSLDRCPHDNPNDSDGDTVCDSADRCPGKDDRVDADKDGIPDCLDPCLKGPNTDGDGNGFPDACEAVLWAKSSTGTLPTATKDKPAETFAIKIAFDSCVSFGEIKQWIGPGIASWPAPKCIYPNKFSTWIVSPFGASPDIINGSASLSGQPVNVTLIVKEATVSSEIINGTWYADTKYEYTLQIRGTP